MTKITRRTAIFTSSALLAASSAGCESASQQIQAQFSHGVASGDPTSNALILWTRISPTDTQFNGSISIKWEISTQRDFARVTKRGKATTSPAKDYTVKIDVTRLKSGQDYYYRFKHGTQTSPIGHAKTLPSGEIDMARFAVVSCSNYPFGFFNVYDHIAKQNHFDAVIHLGDYFYEYGRDGYGGDVGKKIGREHEPSHECIKLRDYRTRHAQYKTDLSAQAMHAAHTMICVWDDHETANDSWKSGAENHNANEGSWDERRQSAMQAYYEWMPVRDPRAGRSREDIFRHYEFGSLLSLTSIETRLTARNRPIDYAKHLPNLKSREDVGNFIKKIIWDPTRKMMGAAQSEFVNDSLAHSQKNKLAWRLIANQVIMARTAMPDLTAYKGEPFIKEIEKVFPQINDYIAVSPLGLPLNPDAWDGYPAAREQFYAMVEQLGIHDLLVLTGDTHENWINTLNTHSGVKMGIEFGVSGVTSPGTGAYFGKAAPDFSRRLNDKNPDILYHDNQNHSYIDLRLTQDNGFVDFISVDTIYSSKYEAKITKSVTIQKETNSIGVEVN